MTKKKPNELDCYVRELESRIATDSMFSLNKNTDKESRLNKRLALAKLYQAIHISGGK